MAPEVDSSWRGLGSYAFVGTTLVMCIVVGLAGGYWADRWLGTQPWLLLLGLGLGIAAGVVNLFRAVNHLGGFVGGGGGGRGRGGRRRAAEFPLARSQRGERCRSRAGRRLGRRGPSRRVASPPFHGWRPRPAPGERLDPPARGDRGPLGPAPDPGRSGSPRRTRSGLRSWEASSIHRSS